MRTLQNSLDRTYIPSESFDKILRWCHKKNDRDKLVVIESLEKMNPIVMSKFLKTLEDPPKNVYFILITENFIENASVLMPLKSRSLVIHFFSLRGYINKIAKRNFRVENSKSLNDSAEKMKEFIESYGVNDEKERDFLMVLNPKFSLKGKISYLEKRKYDFWGFLGLVRYGIESFLENPQKFKRHNVNLNLSRIARINYALNNGYDLAKKHQVIEKNLMIKILILFS